MKPRKIVYVFALASMVFLGTFGGNALAQTNVSGSQSGTWNLIGSPYIAINDVWVPVDSTLTVEPGVEVRFDGNYRLTVYGTLIANGTSGQNITFTSNQGVPQPGDWEGIFFEDSSVDTVCILNYCTISYGGNYWAQFGAVELINASPTISNSTIMANEYGVKCGGSSAPTISTNTFTGNVSTPVLISLLSNPAFSGNPSPPVLP
jgi:hypothetical protein